MEIFMEMSTTARHNKLSGTLFSEIINLLRKKEVHALSEEGALVYWGTKKEPQFIRLVNAEEIEDPDNFVSEVISDLYYVQPDFFVFKNNPYLCNKKGTRTAGYPDLIVEVWSGDNTTYDRKVKLDLYSSSPVTEHWYIEQNINEVVCYYGEKRLANQYLTDVLVTRGGLEFDLRYLAV
ncbi:MAG: Uma2 family endonuclease [Oscillospiraceae bacterium]|nr:Uma2 family endonuclease [Oscillospiraceae bacterium]